MKRAIGWCLLCVLYGMYYILVAIIGMRRNWFVDHVVYPIYQRLMRLVVRVQDWSGVNGPWSNP